MKSKRNKSYKIGNGERMKTNEVEWRKHGRNKDGKHSMLQTSMRNTQYLNLQSLGIVVVKILHIVYV